MDPENKPQPKEKIKKSVVDSWIADGVPCYYVRFHSPVAPSKNKEPVGEFYCRVQDRKYSSMEEKYLVTRTLYTPHGVIFWAQGECDITPLANVQWARFTL